MLDSDEDFRLSQEFVKFREYSTGEHALDLIELLKGNNIDFRASGISSDVGKSFTGGIQQDEVTIKLRRKDFPKANKLLEEVARGNIKEISKDHYLFEFTDEELVEILQKPEEWSEEDYLLAQNILSERGKNYTKEQLSVFKQQALEQSAKPKNGDGFTIFFGYATALLGGLPAIIIGWHLMTSKRTLSNGEKVVAYNKQSQKHGFRILVIGIVAFLAWVTYRITKTN